MMVIMSFTNNWNSRSSKPPLALNTKCRNNYFFDVSINFLTEHKRKLDFFYLSGITRKIPPESEIASRDKKKRFSLVRKRGWEHESSTGRSFDEIVTNKWPAFWVAGACWWSHSILRVPLPRQRLRWDLTDWFLHFTPTRSVQKSKRAELDFHTGQ